MNDKNLYWTSVATAHGDCFIIATEKGICWVGTPGTPLEKGVEWINKHFNTPLLIRRRKLLKILETARRQLKEYFDGKRTTFRCPFDINGTEFQKALWNELLKIPYGETRSYGVIAKAMGQPKAMRAVGAACGANPITIMIPCHRVVGSDGSLTGYGGGLSIKRWLLRLEGKNSME